MSMYGDGLDITKLMQYPFRQISDNARSIFEPSIVKTDSLEWMCLEVLLIRVHENKTKIHVNQLRSCRIRAA